MAWGSSTGSIETRGSSTGHIETRETSTLEAKAYQYSRVLTRGKINVKAHTLTTVISYDNLCNAEGGNHIIIDLSTPAAWCGFYGVKTEDDKALLFKGVNSNFKSERGGEYTPKTIPKCSNWDGGKIECGAGYHVSPSPKMTLEFCTPSKFVAGWVNFSDMAVHPNGDYPQKCKIHKYASPVWECDENGEPV